MGRVLDSEIHLYISFVSGTELGPALFLNSSALSQLSPIQSLYPSMNPKKSLSPKPGNRSRKSLYGGDWN
jgi:hypothetical protein